MRLIVITALIGASVAASARPHPANIPSALAKVSPDRSVELRIRFDILAFVLDMTPEEVADRPMLALLEGKPSALQLRLDEAKKRFMASLTLGWHPKKVSFPNAKEVLAAAAENKDHKLPIMLSVVVRGQLPRDAKRMTYRFPEVLGPVILTSELPYREPVSERVLSKGFSTPVSLIFLKREN